ncbi:MAG: hypothetical protein QGI24_02810 [Kiritimatiellia bacterium]|jgi:hypothetical protein|nr:hypothetical protein [Kiritimatiellia bacterium]MDP6847695.1 hypothetical protein [Kiritimatiellia bacterium]
MAKAQIQNWFEWKRQCALALCSPCTRHVLRQFAHARFRYYVAKYLHRTNLRNPAVISVEDRQAWHLFESHLELKTTRRGKAYKNWLLSRANEDEEGAIQALESGASLIVRDVVREFMRKEISPPRTMSLSRPLNDDFARPMTMADLLPGEIDPTSKVEMREYSELAGGHAGDAFDDMKRREKIAVFCRSMGISLAHHVVAEITGCRKSSLSNSYRDAITRIASHIQHKYVKEDSESVKTLTLMTVQIVKEKVVAWAKLEKSCARLFKVAE